MCVSIYTQPLYILESLELTLKQHLSCQRLFPDERPARKNMLGITVQCCVFQVGTHVFNPHRAENTSYGRTASVNFSEFYGVVCISNGFGKRDALTGQHLTELAVLLSSNTPPPSGCRPPRVRFLRVWCSLWSVPPSRRREGRCRRVPAVTSGWAVPGIWIGGG